ncbi:hypothetical protein BgiBS90_025020 [Biomphalaria glabrata]|nr:hypothetical protein BgiBS90_025020 [Biomphalaria glabrata]
MTNPTRHLALVLRLSARIWEQVELPVPAEHKNILFTRDWTEGMSSVDIRPVSKVSSLLVISVFEITSRFMMT